MFDASITKKKIVIFKLLNIVLYTFCSFVLKFEYFFLWVKLVKMLCARDKSIFFIQPRIIDIFFLSLKKYIFGLLTLLYFAVRF